MLRIRGRLFRSFEPGLFGIGGLGLNIDTNMYDLAQIMGEGQCRGICALFELVMESRQTLLEYVLVEAGVFVSIYKSQGMGRVSLTLVPCQ